MAASFRCLRQVSQLSRPIFARYFLRKRCISRYSSCVFSCLRTERRALPVFAISFGKERTPLVSARENRFSSSGSTGDAPQLSECIHYLVIDNLSYYERKCWETYAPHPPSPPHPEIYPPLPPSYPILSYPTAGNGISAEHSLFHHLPFFIITQDAFDIVRCT